MLFRPQGSMQQLQPLLLLCTGTIVVIANQIVSNQGATHPQAQMLTLVRYLGTFSLSAILMAREKRAKSVHNSTANGTTPPRAAAAASPRPRLLLLVLLLVGCLDVGCYSLYNLGFSWCGSALATIILAASGQIATAVLSVVVLKRQLLPRHFTAVGIVTIGLLLRSMDTVLDGSMFATSKESQGSKQTYGALFVMLSALLFSILGIIYEKRSEVPNHKGSQAQTSFAVSGVSLTITIIYQLMYCLPNFQQLVLDPLAASGHSIHSVVLTHATYGLITAVHQFVQLKVLAGHGAMSVGLVNAVRASVISVVSSLLFCRAKPALCLTYWRGLSALVVTLGAVQWVVAGKPLTRKQELKKQA